MTAYPASDTNLGNLVKVHRSPQLYMGLGLLAITALLIGGLYLYAAADVQSTRTRSDDGSALFLVLPCVAVSIPCLVSAVVMILSGLINITKNVKEYERGMVISGKPAIRWDEIVEVRQSHVNPTFWQDTLSSALAGPIPYVGSIVGKIIGWIIDAATSPQGVIYTVVTKNQEYKITSAYGSPNRVGNLIEDRITPQFASKLDAGETLSFGRLKVTNDGVHYRVTMLPWEMAGTARISGRGARQTLNTAIKGKGVWHRIEREQTPNSRVLANLINQRARS
jgi:hypothetical protein